MNKSHLTAIHRKTLSLPAKYLLDQGLLSGRVLDYGCGRGTDARLLGATPYDPYYFPSDPGRGFNIIICTYVLNTIPSKSARRAVIKDIHARLASQGMSYITVRRGMKEGFRKKWFVARKCPP